MKIEEDVFLLLDKIGIENDENVIVLFSGGKDATLLLHLLERYRNKRVLKFKIKPVLVAYPLHMYFNKDCQKNDQFCNIIQYWKNRNIMIDINLVNSSVSDITSKKEQCSVCKSERMSVVNNVLSEEPESLIITGYTLYDAIAYYMEIQLRTNLWLDKDLYHSKRIKNCLHKMCLVEKLPKGRIARPLLGVDEFYIPEYLAKNKIPFINIPCIAANHKLKRALFNIYNDYHEIINVDYRGINKFVEMSDFNIRDFSDINFDTKFVDC